MSSIKVGDASQCFSVREQTNGHYDPLAWCRFEDSIKGVLGFPKHPYFPETGPLGRQNATSATMVRLADGNNSLGRV
jgi:hypothetical protein